MSDKVIQICCSGVECTNATQANWVLFALKENGEIWLLDNAHAWYPVEEIPILEKKGSPDA